MKKIIYILLTALVLTGCALNILTGRKQLSLVQESELQLMAKNEYNTFLSENKVLSSGSSREAASVDRVGARISKAITKYFATQGQESLLEGYKWEFNTVESKDINAWCMPGGKVAVYTGILPITQDATGLAVVMGHEISHAIAKHGNERMSQGMLAQLGAVGLSTALSTNPGATSEIFMAAYGLGANVGVLLPYSRIQESEADHIGLILMAKAGYDPREAVPFWKRMNEKGGNRPPEFLSTHPAPETRIKDIEAKIPEAMKYYKRK